MSFYAKQKDKREKRKVDEVRWGAANDWTNIRESEGENGEAGQGG